MCPGWLSARWQAHSLNSSSSFANVRNTEGKWSTSLFHVDTALHSGEDSGSCRRSNEYICTSPLFPNEQEPCWDLWQRCSVFTSLLMSGWGWDWKPKLGKHNFVFIGLNRRETLIFQHIAIAREMKTSGTHCSHANSDLFSAEWRAYRAVLYFNDGVCWRALQDSK